MSRPKSIAIQLVFLALFAGGAAALWYGQDYVTEVIAAISGTQEEGRERRGSGRDGVPVVVARVDERADDTSIDAIATARARRFVTLYPEVSGEIVAFNVRAGDRVEKDDVILSLDTDDTELAVELAQVKVAEADRALDRANQLLRTDVNSRAKVQDMRALLDRARLELKQAERDLAKRTLRAPFAGVVGIPKVEIGDRISEQTAVITVDDRSELLVEIEVAEQHLGAIDRGQAVTARTPGYPDRTFEGTVDRIDSRVDPQSRSVMVRAALPNPDDLLRPGMSFAVDLIIPGKAYATVPELALQWGKGESYVWRVRDGKAERVVVRAVRRLAQVILIDGDIAKGDLVVVEGVQRLRDGRPVAYTEPGATAES